MKLHTCDSMERRLTVENMTGADSKKELDAQNSITQDSHSSRFELLSSGFLLFYVIGIQNR